MAHDSDSAAQAVAEAAIRSALNASEGWNLSPARLEIAPGTFVDIDGVDRESHVAVEIIARIGGRSASRDKKVVSDAAKLFIAQGVLGENFRLLIVGCDEDFIAFYREGGRKWQSHALAKLGVEIRAVSLAPGVLLEVLAAQDRQARSNVKRT